MRFTAVYTILTACVLACAPALAANGSRTPVAEGPPLSAVDQQFLVAREAARAGDRAKLAQVAPQLANHPLVAYVEYWQLAPRLRSADPTVTAAVEEFFTRYADTYLADRLRLDWSLALAERGDFTGFEREAGRLVWNTDDTQLRCYGTLARYRNSANAQTEVVAREARQLLANTRDSAGDGCLALTEALLADERIAVWERVRALVEQNQLPTAKRVGARALDGAGQAGRPEAAGPGDRSTGGVSDRARAAPDPDPARTRHRGHCAAGPRQPERGGRVGGRAQPAPDARAARHRLGPHWPHGRAAADAGGQRVVSARRRARRGRARMRRGWTKCSNGRCAPPCGPATGRP